MQLLLVVNILAFVEAIRIITNVESRLDVGTISGPCRDLELKSKLFVNQRNSYIAGFNVFLSLVFYRLYVTMKQVHEWRNDIKAREEADKAATEHQAGAKKDN